MYTIKSIKNRLEIIGYKTYEYPQLEEVELAAAWRKKSHFWFCYFIGILG